MPDVAIATDRSENVEILEPMRAGEVAVSLEEPSQSNHADRE